MTKAEKQAVELTEERVREIVREEIQKVILSGQSKASERLAILTDQNPRTGTA